MKLKLDEHEYVIRIRAAAYPHLQTLSAAFTTAPPSKDDLIRAEEEVIATCVNPQPCDEHYDVVLAAILQRYTEVMRSIAKNFRP
jgi:hypothetical protein